MNSKEAQALVGKCEGCRYSWTERFDPSPAGISLSPGYMEDAGCHADDFLVILPEVDVEEWGVAEPCPLWCSNIHYCERHGYQIGRCEICVDEAMYEDWKDNQEVEA